MALAFVSAASVAVKEDCRSLLASDLTNRGALHRLGDLLFAEGDVVEARATYSKAVACYPDDPTSLVSLARLLIEERGLESALGPLRHALEVDPLCRAAHAGLSFVLADLGDLAQAKSHQLAAFQGGV